MQTQNTKQSPDFTGQNIYVGIDTHFKNWMVSIYSDEFELKTFGQEPDVDRLENYFANVYLRHTGLFYFSIFNFFASKIHTTQFHFLPFFLNCEVKIPCYIACHTHTIAKY